MHECLPQSAVSWLSCLSSSRWFWVWAPRWPGTQMMRLHPRCLFGPLGFWRNLAGLKTGRAKMGRGRRDVIKGREQKEEGEAVRKERDKGDVSARHIGICDLVIYGYHFLYTKATKRAKTGIVAEHTCSSLMEETSCLCLPASQLYHVQFLSSSLRYRFIESKVHCPWTMKFSSVQ